ncbi:MAG: DUF47 domain-containing protein [Candidatus Cryosericum sp.]|jgi:uncharacterized protein
MRIWDQLFKKGNEFQRLLVEQASLAHDGMKVLDEFLGVASDVPDASEKRHNMRLKLKNTEESGDKARRELINTINSSLVTPLERQDLFNLSNVLDNILDYALNTADEMIIYDIYPDFYLTKMVEKLMRGVSYLEGAVEDLLHDKQTSNNSIVKAKSMENEIEETYHEALASLFSGDDFKYMFKMREVLRHISNAADRIADAADIMGNIIIKDV